MKLIRFRPSFKKPDGLLTIVVLCTFVLGFEAGGFQLALLKVANEFRISGTMMGGMATAQCCAFIVTPLLFGTLADRAGKKLVMLIFSGVFIFGSLVTAAAPSPWVFMAGVFILGAGFSVCESTTSAAVADAYGEKSPKYLNLVQCGFSLGAASGPLLADFAITRTSVGWRMVFILCGAAYLALWPVIRRAPFSGVAPVERELEESGPRRMPITAAFVCLVILVGLYVGMENGTGFFVDSLFAMGLDKPGASAAAISSFWFAMMASRFLSGMLRRLPKGMLAACFGGSAVVLSVLMLTGSATVASVGCAILGFLFGPIWPMLIGLAAQEAPEHSGMATGIMVASGGLGSAVTPVLMGFFTDLSGIKSAFVMLMIVAVFSAAVSLTYMRAGKKNSGAL